MGGKKGIYGSDLLLHALLSSIPTQDSTMVYFDTRNPSHHFYIDTNVHSMVFGGYYLGIGSGNDIMTQATVNTIDW